MPLLLTIADRGTTDLARRHFVTDMFPSRGQLGRAFRDLIDFLNWTKIAIVYDDEEGKRPRNNIVVGGPGESVSTRDREEDERGKEEEWKNSTQTFRVSRRSNSLNTSTPRYRGVSRVSLLKTRFD